MFLHKVIMSSVYLATTETESIGYILSTEQYRIAIVQKIGISEPSTAHATQQTDGQPYAVERPAFAGPSPPRIRAAQ